MSNGAEQVTYSIHVKTSDKLFAGTDNDVYIRIGCLKYKRRLCWKILQIHRFHKYRGFANTKVLQILRFGLRLCKYSKMTLVKFSSRDWLVWCLFLNQVTPTTFILSQYVSVKQNGPCEFHAIEETPSFHQFNQFRRITYLVSFHCAEFRKYFLRSFHTENVSEPWKNDSCIIQKRLVGEKDSKQITSDEYLLAQKGRNDFEENQVDCFNISYSPLG